MADALHTTRPPAPGAVAAVLFSLWQGIEFDWSRYGGWAGLGSMIALQLLLLAFMSLAVLPVYALTTAAGSHSAASGACTAAASQPAGRRAARLDPGLLRRAECLWLHRPVPPGPGGASFTASC